MKYFKPILICLAALSLLTFYACSKDEDPTEEEQLEQARQKVIQTLSEAPWEPASVLREGTNAIGEYEGFQLEIKEGTFKTINGGQAWPESGTWQFVEGQSNQLLRDDGVLMTVVDKGGNVEISFTFAEQVFAEGRTKTTQTFIAFLLKTLEGLFGS